MNLWQIITGTSALPIQVGNNLWDHLNNQQGGGGGLGGRADLALSATNESLVTFGNDQSISMTADSSGIKLKADKEGLTV